MGSAQDAIEEQERRNLQKQSKAEIWTPLRDKNTSYVTTPKC